MKRDFFQRPTRMVHKFGELERINDPLGAHTFDPPKHLFPGQLSSPSMEIQQYGEHDTFAPARSGVSKPNGRLANTTGPAPDWAQAIAAPIPVSTKKRVGHLKTDK